MIDSLQRTTTFALYQLTLALGIALMPVALLVRRVGITLPLDQLIRTTSEAYEAASAE